MVRPKIPAVTRPTHHASPAHEEEEIRLLREILHAIESLRATDSRDSERSSSLPDALLNIASAAGEDNSTFADVASAALQTLGPELLKLAPELLALL